MIPRGNGRIWAGALAVVLGGAACGRNDVTHFRVPKEAPSAGASLSEPGAAPDAPLPGASDPSPAPRGRGLRWTLPRGWSEAAGGAMRFATLKPPVAGKLDASVVVLPGPAGGELANVNRWRGQIGLPALDESGLAKLRKVLNTRAGPVKVYDFTSEAAPRSRLVAGLTEGAGETWFVKMAGDAEAVAAARHDFIQLLGSLRFE